MEDKVIKPVHFLNEEEKNESKEEETDNSKLVLNSKYGKIDLNLSEIPFVKDLF